MNREKMRIAKKTPIFPIEQIICTYEEIFIFNVNRKKILFLSFTALCWGAFINYLNRVGGRGSLENVHITL